MNFKWAHSIRKIFEDARSIRLHMSCSLLVQCSYQILIILFLITNKIRSFVFYILPKCVWRIRLYWPFSPLVVGVSLVAGAWEEVPSVLIRQLVYNLEVAEHKKAKINYIKHIKQTHDLPLNVYKYQPKAKLTAIWVQRVKQCNWRWCEASTVVNPRVRHGSPDSPIILVNIFLV